ncbi:MAG: response regulator [Suipraeoptans sp.]
MMKVVLVDDENLVINHLIELLYNRNLPLEIVGTANSTWQAMKVCKEKKPDLVITDIRMGSSNGLDLCEDLKVALPYTKIIILSGYDDFQYAQRALLYNVIGYMLKPIDEDELYNKVKVANSIFIDDEMQKDNSDKLREQLIHSLPLMKDWFFHMIHLYHDNPKQLKENLSLFQIDILNNYYQVIYINLTRQQKDNTLESNLESNSRMVNTFSIFIEKDTKSLFFYNDYSVIIILSEETDIAINELSNKLSEKIKQYITFNYDSNFSIGLSSPTKDISYLNTATKDANLASNYSFYMGYGEIVCITDVESRDNITDGFSDFANVQEKILKYIKLCDTEHTQKQLRIFSLALLQMRLDINFMKNKYIELYFYLSNSIIREFEFLKAESNTIHKQLEESSKLEETQKIVEDYVYTLISKIWKSRTDKNQAFINNTKRYIETHFKNNISLEVIAEEIGLSPCYLSTLFSNSEKISIKEYIINIRIEASKQLLKDTSLKIYEVAGSVGYMDSRYFSQLFKKKTGYTPKQYQEFRY